MFLEIERLAGGVGGIYGFQDFRDHQSLLRQDHRGLVLEHCLDP